MFGSERYGYQPDMITCAKGITSGYAPLGAMIASDKLMEPFLEDGAMFAHGYTFGGHPVSTAVALANLDAFENEKILENVRDNEAAFRATLERLKDLPIVGDVRGDGYFYGIELVKDKATRRPSPTRSASGCCSASSPSSSTPRASTAAPTTAATRSSSSRRR